MAIIYVDPIDGNDGNNGLSFAARKKTIRNATSGRYSGDEVRIIRTPGGLLGNATWKSKINTGAMSWNTNQVSAPGGIGGILRFYQTNHNLETGDWIMIFGFSVPAADGYHRVIKVDNNYFDLEGTRYGGSWSFYGTRYWAKLENCIVELDAPKSKNLVLNRDPSVRSTSDYPSWTAGIYNTVNNYYPAGISYDCVLPGAPVFQLDISSSFSTGNAAYHTFPQTLDLSEYRQISLFAWQSGGNYNSNVQQLSIRLCSDANGQVPVYTFPLPQLGRTYEWKDFTIDCSNLPAGQTMTTPINSIAFYVDADYGYFQGRFQGIIACKDRNADDCVSHTSHISTKRTGDQWWPVFYADEQYLFCSNRSREYQFNFVNNTTSNWIGYMYYPEFSSQWDSLNKQFVDAYYYKITETQPCYVYNPINTDLIERGTNVMSTGNLDTSGAAVLSNGITVSGGWNRTDMSTRDDDNWDLSWFDTGNATTGNGLTLYNKTDCVIENIGCSGGVHGLFVTNNTHRCVFNRIHTSGNHWAGLRIQSAASGCEFNDCYLNDYFRNYWIGSNAYNIEFNNVKSVGSATPLDASSCGDIRFNDCLFYNNMSTPINLASYNHGFTFNRTVFKYCMSGVAIPRYNVRKLLFKECTFDTFGSAWTTYLNNSYGANGDFTFIDCNWTRINQSAYGFPEPQNDNILGPTMINQMTNNNLGNYPLVKMQWPNGKFLVYSGTSEYRNNSSTTQTPGKSLAINSRGVPTHYAEPFVTESDPDNNIYAQGIGRKVKLATASVTAGKNFTFKAQVLRSHSSVNACLICEPSLPGMLDSVYSPQLTATNLWEELTLTFPITWTGTLDIEILILCASSSTTLNLIYVDSLECSEQ